MKDNTKHKDFLDVQGKGIDQILTEISDMSNEEIQLFLKQLWTKIKEDAEADKARKRENLSTALFECAKTLAELSEKQIIL